MYSKDEIAEMVEEITEKRATKLNLLKWLDFELQKIVNKKRWWWRRKSFTLTLAPGTATYNLARSPGLDKADDLESMIILYLVDSSGNVSELYYTSDPFKVAQILANTSSDTPCYWTFEPGAQKTIRLDKKPLAGDTLYGIYWAGFNPSSDSSDRSIPLIPENYQYVALDFLLKRVCFYLFGVKDSRYVAAAADAQASLNDLLAYNEPGARQAVEFRDVSPESTVRATS